MNTREFPAIATAHPHRPCQSPPGGGHAAHVAHPGLRQSSPGHRAAFIRANVGEATLIESIEHTPQNRNGARKPAQVCTNDHEVL